MKKNWNCILYGMAVAAVLSMTACAADGKTENLSSLEEKIQESETTNFSTEEKMQETEIADISFFHRGENAEYGSSEFFFSKGRNADSKLRCLRRENRRIFFRRLLQYS